MTTKFLFNFKKRGAVDGHDLTLSRVGHKSDSIVSRFSLVSLICLCMLTVGVGNVWGTPASVGTVMYSEDWSGYGTDGTVPSGSVSSSTGRVVYTGSVTYTCSNGTKTSGSTNGGTTQIKKGNAEKYAGGSTPELMIGKKGSGTGAVGGKIQISGIPNGEADSLTLTYKQNGNSLDVSISGTGYYLRSGNNDVTSVNNSSAGTKTYAIACGSGSTFTLTFQAAASSNVRLDDISISVRTAGSSESVAVTGVTVSPTSKTILVGETFTVTPTVSPVGATDKSVSWTSSASGKASVNSSGVVTGVAAGTANITCTTTDGSFTATCATTVYSASVTSIVDEDGTDISSSGVSASVSGRTLTASEGSTKYKFKTWKYGTASGTSISSATSLSTTLSGTPTGNVTLIAEFYKPVEVAWTKGGTTYSTGGPTTSVKRGTQWKDLTIPTAPGDAALGSCADKFMGWSNCSDLIGTGNSAPAVLFTSVSGITTEITTPIEFKAVFATAGAGGAGEKIKITPTNSSLPAAGSYNGSATSFTIGDYTFKHTNWCKSANPPATYNIQAKKDNTYSVYNVDPFENLIDHIIVYQTGTNRDVTITGSYYYDSDEAEEAGDTFEEEEITAPSTAATMSFDFSGNDHRYFYMSTPGNAVYMDSIVIYTRNSISYSDYVTKCCTNLASINGSFKWSKELEDIESPYSFNIYLVYFSMSKIAFAID